MLERAPNTVFLSDFLSPAQRADAAASYPRLDVATAFQSAIDATPPSATLYVEPGLKLRVRSGLQINRPLTLRGYGATIVFDFPASTGTSAGGLINVAASNVTIEGLSVVGERPTFGLAVANRYAVLCRSGRTRYADLTVRHCRFENLMQCAGEIPATSTASHAIYLRGVDRPTVHDTAFESLSGGGVYLFDTTEASVRGNRFARFGWSGICVHDSNCRWTIDNNSFSDTTPSNPSYWGAAIDIMGQTADESPPGEPDQDGRIVGNRFIGGVYRYGQVVRLSSARSVIVQGNIFDRCDAENNSRADATPGSSGPGGQNNCVTLTVRDVTRSNGPHKRITIRNNTFIAAGAGHQKGIYAITTSGTKANRTPCEDLLVEGNVFVCPDAANYFGANLTVHGFAAGYRRIQVRSNRFAGDSNSNPNYRPGGVPGLVVFMSDLLTDVEGVVVEANSFDCRSRGLAQRVPIGVNIQPNVTRVVLHDNRFVSDGSHLVDPGNRGTVEIDGPTNR